MTIQALLDTLDGVDEENKAFYAEKDGKFELDIAKYTQAQIAAETGGLKSKVDELLGEKKTAKEKADAAEEAARKARDEAARKSGDVEALEASWSEKLAAQAEAAEAEKAALNKSIQALTVGAEASRLAGELAVEGSASLLERVITDRLSVEHTDNGPLIRVLDVSGKPSASSIDDLKAELTADPALAPIISGSKAQGGGAAGAGGGAAKPNGLAGAITAKVPGFADLPEK